MHKSDKHLVPPPLPAGPSLAPDQASPAHGLERFPQQIVGVARPRSWASGKGAGATSLRIQFSSILTLLGFAAAAAVIARVLDRWARFDKRDQSAAHSGSTSPLSTHHIRPDPDFEHGGAAGMAEERSNHSTLVTEGPDSGDADRAALAQTLGFVPVSDHLVALDMAEVPGSTREARLAETRRKVVTLRQRFLEKFGLPPCTVVLSSDVTDLERVEITSVGGTVLPPPRGFSMAHGAHQKRTALQRALVAPARPRRYRELPDDMPKPDPKADPDLYASLGYHYDPTDLEKLIKRTNTPNKDWSKPH